MSILWLVTASLAACPHQARVENRPPAKEKLMKVVSPRTPPRIRNLSESEPVVALTYLAGYLYAATPTQVLRYDVRSGKHVRITGRQGLPGGRLLALSAHKKSGLWVATDQGIFQHHGGKWRGHGRGLPRGNALVLAATASGAWAGGPAGLAELRDNKWRAHLRGTPVRHLLARGDDLWIGTAGQGIHRFREGKLEHHGAGRGQVLRHVRGLTLVGERGVMAAGRAQKRERLTYFDGQYWSTYTIKAPGRARWIQQMDDGVLLAHGERLLLLRLGEDAAGDALALDGEAAREAPWRYKAPAVGAEVVKQWLPRRPTALFGHQGHAMVGTPSLGVALLGGGKVRWFRTHDLLGTRERLRMACARGACYVPGTNGRAFREDSKGFTQVKVTEQPGARVQAFTNDQWGGVVALHTPAAGRSLVVSEQTGQGRFSPVYEARIKIPAKTRLQVRFLRTDPTGRMWIGLWAAGARGHRQPWGMVVMRPPPSHAAVTWTPGKKPSSTTTDSATTAHKIPVEEPSFFHRSTLLPGESRPARSLAVPNDTRDAYFERGKTWIATGDGVCLIRGTEVGTEVKLTTENEGIRSELIYGFARAPGSFRPEGAEQTSPGRRPGSRRPAPKGRLDHVRIGRGDLLVASFAGVGRQQGRRWVFDLERPLRTATRKLLIQGDLMWAGTTQGLARVKGRRAVLVDSTHGLAHDAVLDLYLDATGERMWVLTEGGLSMVSLRGF